MKKKVISVIISLIMLFTMAFSFAACTGDNELQAQIDDLKNQIEQLEEQIEQLEEQIGQLEEQIKQLEEETAITGQFYTLEEAYNQNLITTQNLQQIAYYRDNVLMPDEPLSEEIATDIKTAWAKLQNEEKNLNPPATKDMIKIYNFYGTYNGCTIIYLDYVNATHVAVDMSIDIEIGGVTFHFGLPVYASHLVAWKYC